MIINFWEVGMFTHYVFRYIHQSNCFVQANEVRGSTSCCELSIVPFARTKVKVSESPLIGNHVHCCSRRCFSILAVNISNQLMWIILC